MFLFFDSLVDMGITPHIPTQNRTCAINAYGFSLYISYSTCKTNLLICAYYIKITFLVSYVSFKVSKKGNQHIVDYLLDYLFKLVKREVLATLHFQGFASFQIQGMRESNSHQRFWRPLSYHLTNPLYTRKSGCWPQILLHCTLKTTYMFVDG